MKTWAKETVLSLYYSYTNNISQHLFKEDFLSPEISLKREELLFKKWMDEGNFVVSFYKMHYLDEM